MSDRSVAPETPGPVRVCISMADPNTCRLHLTGELDLRSVDHLGGVFESLHEAEIRSALVDLSGVSFIDSTGIRLLLRQVGVFRERGGRLVLEGASTAVQHVLDLTHTGWLFRPSVEAEFVCDWTQSDN